MIGVAVDGFVPEYSHSSRFSARLSVASVYIGRDSQLALVNRGSSGSDAPSLRTAKISQCNTSLA